MKIRNLEQLIDQLKKKLPDYLAMHGRVSGNDNKFQCPNATVHRNNDATPACNLMPSDDEHFYCHVCSATGDIFNAVHFIEGRPISGEGFISQNVAYLADMFKIPYLVAEETEEKIEEHRVVSRVSELLELVATMLSFTIGKKHEATKEIKKYVKERGWIEAVDIFKLGWCRYDRLVEALNKRGYSQEDLKSAGIGPSDRYLFDNRLVIPIRNQFGSVVAFASRAIKKGIGSKYLNSRETVLYRKGEVLFYLYKARTISSKVYVVEGYADVITLAQSGLENVVALCGTAMTEKHYELLVKCGIRSIVFCLDNEKGARVKLDTILHKIVGNKADLDVYIKTLPKWKDPDDFVSKEGIEKFKSIPELSIFEYQLARFLDNQDDRVLLDECLFAIHRETSPIAKEKLLKDMVDKTGIGKQALNKEIQQFESQGVESFVVTVSDILEEQTKMGQVVTNFEEWAWNRDRLLGLSMGWKDTTNYFDGLQNSFYLLVGDTNVGKSSFCLQLATNLITSNESKVFVLYFSIDDNTRKVIPRLLANYSGVDINVVSNPKYRIQHNEDLDEDQRMILAERRDNAVNTIRDMVASSWSIKDVSDGYTLEYFARMVRIYKKIAGDKQLVVFIDNLHKMGLEKKTNESRDKWTDISEGLKRLVSLYDIPIFCTVERRKGSSTSRKAPKEDMKLFHIVDGSKVLPVVRARVEKNKTSGFKGNLFYKFYPSIAKFDEVSEIERVNFNKANFPGIALDDVRESIALVYDSDVVIVLETDYRE